MKASNGLELKSLLEMLESALDREYDAMLYTPLELEAYCNEAFHAVKRTYCKARRLQQLSDEDVESMRSFIADYCNGIREACKGRTTPHGRCSCCGKKINSISCLDCDFERKSKEAKAIAAYLGKPLPTSSW